MSIKCATNRCAFQHVPPLILEGTVTFPFQIYDSKNVNKKWISLQRSETVSGLIETFDSSIFEAVDRAAKSSRSFLECTNVHFTNLKQCNLQLCLNPPLTFDVTINLNSIFLSIPIVFISPNYRFNESIKITLQQQKPHSFHCAIY